MPTKLTPFNETETEGMAHVIWMTDIQDTYEEFGVGKKTGENGSENCNTIQVEGEG